MLTDIDKDLILYNSPFLLKRSKSTKKIKVSWHVKQVLASNTQNILLRGGYGAGKSKFLAIKAVSLLRRDGTNILMMTLNYGYIQKVLIPYCVWALNMIIGLDYKINLQNKYIFVPNYGYIYFFSYADPTTLVSINVGHVLLDELDEQNKEKARLAFEYASSRKRLKIANGMTSQTIIATTPRGIGSYCFDLFENENKHNKDYIQFQVPTFANYRNLRDTYVKEQMTILPPNKVLSHIYGQWAPSTTDLVYYCFSDDNKFNESNPLYPKEIDLATLLVGLDFNIGKMAAVIGVEKIIDNSRKIIIFDEIFGVKNTEEIIKILKSRYPKSFITVYPDFSGGNRNTSTDDTDISLLKASGMKVITRPNPFVKDRVNIVNSSFKNALGEITTYVCVKCKNFITALNSQGYKNGEPDKTQGHDHMLDAGGYLIYNRIGRTQIRGYQ